MLQTVVQTQVFAADAKDLGISEAEIVELANVLAETPDAGDAIPGTGGCRKVRIAGRGKGKSGGYRVVTFYSGSSIPVFLLTAYSKGDRANISPETRNALAKLSKALVAAYKKKK